MPKKIRKNHQVVVQDRGVTIGLSDEAVAERLLRELQVLFKEHVSLGHLDVYHTWEVEKVCALCEKPYELFEGNCAWCGKKEPE